MDFKSRFNGKISHITKDGAFDVVIKTEQAKPVLKMESMGTERD